MRPLLLSALAALAIAGAAPPVSADATADAKAHFKKGAELYKATKYQEAIAEFEAAYQLKPAGVLHYNIAQCYEKLGDFPSALRAYHNYLRESPSADDRASTEAAIAYLEKRLAETGVQQLLVYSDPPGAEVTIDGKASGLSPTAVQLAPGSHTVSVAKSGFASAQRPITMAADKSLELSFSLQAGSGTPLVITQDNPATSPAGTTPAGGLTASQPAPAPEHHARLWTWVAAGTAGAALVGGIVLGLAAKGNASTLTNGTVRSGSQNQSLVGTAQGEALGANICYAVSGVAAVGAVGLFFYEGSF